MPEPKLPEPIYIGKRRRWKLSEIVNYERACANLPPLDAPNQVDETYLTAAQLRQRFGVSDMWIWRRRGRQSEEA